MSSSRRQQDIEGPSSSQNDVDFEGISNDPKCFSQNELDDLVRDLDLSKQASELLASKLKEKNLLFSNTKIGFIVKEIKNYDVIFPKKTNFLRNKTSENYIELVEDLLLKLKNMGCNISIKLHFLHSHLSRFPENLEDMSEEQEERMYQNLRVMEER
ncbi:hypothetical protein ACJJTC_011236 [Scirpophaga incertulas]